MTAGSGKEAPVLALRTARLETQVNGKDAEWTAEIWQLWAAHGPRIPAHEIVVQANYFTPRPWRNEYDRGSVAEGFTYTVRTGWMQWDVGQVRIDVSTPWRQQDARREGGSK